jgi:hypothetical protein
MIYPLRSAKAERQLGFVLPPIGCGCLYNALVSKAWYRSKPQQFRFFAQTNAKS